MIKWLRNLFKRELVVHNHHTHVTPYIMTAHCDSLYILTDNGKLYRVYRDFTMNSEVVQHVLTLSTH